VLGAIPGPVMGALLFYLMASQLASGLILLVEDRGVTDFPSGMTVGLPLMLGLIVAFAPAETFSVFPAMLRPVVGNGFVVGTLAVIILEHSLLRRP
ncbi:MAG: xanthine permease, partial [Deltaproteobacteria bacterium]|nr:xanthine permease [Deltaproteobacteria bacterium]